MVSWIYGKRAENGKIWDSRGSFAVAKRPLTAAKILAAAKLKPLFTACKCCVFVSFCFPLFQRLVYWTNEDPISV